MALQLLHSVVKCGILRVAIPEVTNVCALHQVNRLHTLTYAPFSQFLYKTSSSQNFVPVRNSTIFTSLPSNVLWEGVTGPKGSTKKRARGKRRVTRPKIDLNRGQIIGRNAEGYSWPGLNGPLFSQSILNTVQKGDVDEEYIKRLNDLRNKSAVKVKRQKLPPLLRGWTGGTMGGQSLGPLDEGSPGFDTRILEMKVVATMTAAVGRYRRFSALIAAGNGQGVCGIGRGKAVTMKAALKRAKSRAFLNLISFNLKENRTIWHLGHVREWHTTIFASARPRGEGLNCHRVLKTLCETIGIKDLHAKVEGNTKNYLAIVRGFLRLLQEQETYEEVSNRLGLHVVEFNRDNNMVPKVLASPPPGASRSKISHVGLKIDPLILSRLPPPAPKSGRFKSDLPTLYDFWKKSEKPPILTISNPAYPPAVKIKPDSEYDRLDDLVDVEDDESEDEVHNLLARGERDLDNLVTLKGLVLNLNTNQLPAYLKSPGVVKRQAERFRYRNQESSRRERLVYEAIDKISA